MARESAKKTGRARPMTPKAGVTRNPKRRYCGGGKLFKNGGKLKKK